MQKVYPDSGEFLEQSATVEAFGGEQLVTWYMLLECETIRGHGAVVLQGISCRERVKG